MCLLPDAPNVTVDSNVIHTGPDEETKITCNFDANPEVRSRSRKIKSSADIMHQRSQFITRFPDVVYLERIVSVLCSPQTLRTVASCSTSLGPVYTNCQRQHCVNTVMMLAILL